MVGFLFVKKDIEMFNLNIEITTNLMSDLNTPVPVHTTEISSFNDYIQKIESSSFDYEDNKIILYRGQEEDWPLIPKIGRVGSDGSTYSEDKENKILNEFRRLSYPFIDSNYFKYNEWDWLSLAQHYNTPTRLLDWTENPLIALWFACMKEQKNKSNRIVWSYLVKSEEVKEPNIMKSPSNYRDIVVFRPTHIVKRITAQSGWFTVHYFSDAFKWRDPLEKEKNANKYLTKMIITNDDKLRNNILNSLDKMGINSCTVFSDLEGLGNYLQWKYSSRQ